VRARLRARGRAQGAGIARKAGASSALAAALWALAGARPTSLAHAEPAAASDAIYSDGVRVAARRRAGKPLATLGKSFSIQAFRDEVVAFQVVLEGGAEGRRAIEVSLELEPAGADGALPARVELFEERFVEVRSRSRNDASPSESLAFTPSARPDDDDVMGWVAEPLVPLLPGQRFDVPPGERRAVWVDVHVRRDARPGDARATLRVRDGELATSSTPIVLTVLRPALPYGAVSFFAYYDAAGELSARIGDDPRVEPSLLDTLRAHGVEPLVSLRTPADARRLASLMTGELFAPPRYLGPGRHEPAKVAAIGTYGSLGAPTAEKVALVREIAALVPPSVEDVFLYAVDEQCSSPRGPDWRAALRREPELTRVLVGHTCHEDPRAQGVELVMQPANALAVPWAQGARGAGKKVWTYNGRLPWSGTLALDVPATSLRASAWIAATRATGRWFLWETTFWNDDNRGGRGAIDPLVTTETFHNADGDSVLYDGLLVFPGTQRAFPGSSLGLPGVVPSVRLKNLRRGIQDAAILALARASRPTEADLIADRVVPRALDEVGPDEPAAFPRDAEAYDAAVSELRALVAHDLELGRREAALVLAEGAARRVAPDGSTPGTRPRLAARARTWALGALAVLASLASSALVLYLTRRRRRSGLPSPSAPH
jgi:hypothetical protein